MPERPRLSIIIPAYNAERTLRDCLDSALDQDYGDFEVIIVDNGSTDGTSDIISAFKSKSGRLKCLSETTRARGAARNTGEKAAAGDIILMTDSDCVVPKDWVKKMIGPIINDGYNAVQGFEKSASKNFWSAHRDIKSGEKSKGIKEGLVIGKIDTKNFAIKRDVLRRIGYTARKYFSGNDTELSVRLAKNNISVKFLPDVAVMHFHPDSLALVFRKQVYRAKWTAIITRDHIDYLKTTDFLKETCQTPLSFLKFFPGLFGTLIRRGAKYAYYDLVTGISWRLGLLMGTATIFKNPQ